MAKTKMRIQLLSPDLVVEKDRLVDQDTEFNNGPTEVHTGPFRFEFVLRDTQDIDAIKEYIDKLNGKLPIPEKPKKEKSPDDTTQWREQFLEEINELPTQQLVIKTLRDRGFIFMDAQAIEDYELQIELQSDHIEYQFMIKPLKIAKNPSADKYDESLVFGIKIMGEKYPYIQVYMYGKFMQTIRVDWDESSSMNYKKIRPIVFPTYMVEEERLKFSKEHRQLTLDPTKEKSKFYLRWVTQIKLPAIVNK